MSKNLFFLVLVFLFAFINVKSENRNSNFVFGYGIYGTYNFYSSSFKQLTDIPNCCTEFKGANGLGWGGKINGEYIFKNFDLLNDFRIGLALSYGSISAKFSEINDIANIIQGNTYTKGTSEFIINVNLKGLGFEPYISFAPIHSLPLSVNLGFLLFIPTKKDFEQSENLISPQNAYFENNSKVRGQASGQIPNFNGGLFFPTLGLKYEIFDISNIKINAFTNYYYGIHNVVSNLNWKINSLYLGFNFDYRIQKQEIKPPMPPEEPNLPMPPKESIFAFNLNIEHNNKKLSNYDNIEYNILRDKIIISNPILPIVFYKYNTSEFVKYNPENSLLSSYNQLINTIIYELKNNKNSNLTIINSYLKSEAKEIVNLRITNLINFISKALYNEFDISKIKIKEIENNDNDFQNQELASEAINVKFIFDDKPNNLIYHNNISYSNLKLDTLHFKINPIVIADAKPVKIEGEIEYNGDIFQRFNDTCSFRYFEKNLLKLEVENPGIIINTLRFRADAQDAENKTKSEEIQINIDYQLTEVKTIEKFNFTEDNSYRYYLLGFFDFDKSEFNYINNLAISEYQKFSQQNKKITVIALTDNIGNEDYNRKLALKRYETALKLLNSNKNKIALEFPDKYLFDNSMPQGRSYNRSVILKIEK